MFSHVMVGTNDLEKAKTFYDALFTAVGGKEAITDPKGRLIYLHNGGTFLVTPPIDGQPATHANGGTIGFAAKDPAEADAWHARWRRGWRPANRGPARLARRRRHEAVPRLPARSGWQQDLRHVPRIKANEGTAPPKSGGAVSHLGDLM